MATTTTPNLGLTKPTPGTGEPVAIAVINTNMDLIDAHVIDTSTHGVGVVVGTTEAQTLTNKTLTAPVLNNATVNTTDPPSATGQLVNGSLVKGYAYVTVTAGVPALTHGYNVASIVDNGVGDLTINWSRGFSTVGPVVATVMDYVAIHAVAPAAGSCRIRCADFAGALVDPGFYCVIATGVQ